MTTNQPLGPGDTIPSPPPTSWPISPIGADKTQETHPEDLAWILAHLDDLDFEEEA